MIRHAGLVACRVAGRWTGVLIEGPSGSGKSDLALRALEHGFRLVADDRVLLWTCEGRLFGRAPDTLRGLMEIRALGILPVDFLPYCEITLVARLQPAERMPEFATEEILNIPTQLLDVAAFEESAPAKLRRALVAFDAAHKRRI